MPNLAGISRGNGASVTTADRRQANGNHADGASGGGIKIKDIGHELSGYGSLRPQQDTNLTVFSCLL